MKSLATVAVALAVSSSSLLAQTPLTETIEIRVTSVDVAVVDRAGNPVPGLTRDDFELTESGKPQPITNFSEIREATAPSPRRLLIFLDDVSLNPSARGPIFTALETALPALVRSGDEAMIVFHEAAGDVVVPFTADRAELIRRLHEVAGRTGTGLNPLAAQSRIVNNATDMILETKSVASRLNMGQAYNESAKAARILAAQLHASETDVLAGAQRLLTSLAGAEGKKAFVFIGSDLTANPGHDLIQQIDSQFYVFLRGAIRRGNRLAEQQPLPSLAGDLAALARHANTDGVTMYVVDTDRGRVADAAAQAAGSESSAASAKAEPADPTLASLASTTGGLVLPGRTIDKALDALARDLSSYYSLGYRSAEEGEGEGNVDRRISVKVRRPGLVARSRTAFVPRASADELNDRVIANVYHSGVKSDFPVSLSAGTPEKLEDGQYKVKLTVTLPSSMTFVPREDSLVGEFAVAFATGREDGGISEITKAVQPMKFPGNARDAIAARKTFTYDATLVVRPGEQIVSVAVTDTLSGSSGFGRTRIDAH